MYSEHLRIPVGAGTQHVERVGRGGRPVVLLHGFGTSAFLWRKVAPRLAESGLTVLAFDMMGHGESDRLPDAAYGVVAQAEYLDHALTALRLPKAVIVGQDLGALVALQLAARRPERVERLVLINPLDPTDLPGPAIRALQRASARVALGANGLFGAGPLLTPMLREGVIDPAHMPELLAARYLAPFVGGEGVSHLLLLARSVELEEEDQLRLSNVRVPVLFVHGTADASTDAALPAAMATELEHVETRIELFGDAARLVAEDTPGALVAAITRWVNDSLDSSVTDVLTPTDIRSAHQDSADTPSGH